MPRYIGKEMSRVDGVAKVTGRAKYAAEFQVPNLAYGFIVHGHDRQGAIATIDTREAEEAPGVIRVFTHLNAPKLGPKPPSSRRRRAATQERGQVVPRAPVRPDLLQRAAGGARRRRDVRAGAVRGAARQGRRTTAEQHVTDTEAVRERAHACPSKAPPPKPRGNPEAALRTAPVKVEAEYRIPIEHHNPMEPHAAVAVWQGDRLTIFDKTQHVYGVRAHLAPSFGVPEENVTVVSPFVGGAFGSSLRPNYYPALTAMAARELDGRSRSSTRARRCTPATATGRTRSRRWRSAPTAPESWRRSIHEAVHNTSTFEEFSDDTTNFPRQVYACPNLYAPLRIAATDLNTPTWMRAPGAVSGMFALESAMDELAYALKIDPLELRLINYAEVDPESGKPFSSKALRECYRLGAEKFGWKDRKFEPRSMRDGRLLVGWGTATGVWGAFQMPATAQITLRADGTAHVTSATSDMGPGTYTVMTMIAAEYLGLAPEQVHFELGDTKFPQAPAQGGSWTTASVGSAVQGAALAIGARLLGLATREANSPLRGAAAADVEMLDGRLQLKSRCLRGS